VESRLVLSSFVPSAWPPAQPKSDAHQELSDSSPTMAGQGQVHFKFKSTRAFDSVSFGGHYVSVGELKALIAEKKVRCPT